MAAFHEYSIDCTGDVCVGDEIVFEESVFTGSYRKPRFSHARAIEGRILRDSYGEWKQQHTFTIKVHRVHGDSEDSQLCPGKTILRKGRNVYRKGTKRKPWDDESERVKALEEKHLRGKAARRERDRRELFQIFGEDPLLVEIFDRHPSLNTGSNALAVQEPQRGTLNGRTLSWTVSG